MTGPVYYASQYIGAPAARVFKALLDNADVEHYHFTPIGKVEPRVGGALLYGDPNDPAIVCTIEELEQDVKLVHTFHFPHYEDSVSMVTWDIEDMGAMCRLSLTHDGFETETPTWEDVVGGWDVILSSLKTWLETGAELPWPAEASDGHDHVHEHEHDETGLDYL